MNTKTSSRRMALIAVLFAALALTPRPAQAQFATKSPNGFLAPQCTWGADWLAYHSGWTLRFSRSWGNDAQNWWWNVTNATRSNAPKVGSIVVFDQPGHVAYVVSVKGDPWNWTAFTVRHSNWPKGSWIREDTYERAPGDKLVRMKGGKSTYHYLGFLYR